jgi:O-antigen/teichoic acid export membrane protein
MGIIQRQTFKGSLYSYFGILLGFVNVAILSPKIFTTDQIGLTQVLLSIAAIISQIGTLGFNNVTIRLFPYFRSGDKNNSGYPFLMILVGFTGFVLSVGLFLVFRGYLIESNLEKSALLARYIDLLVPLMLVTLAHLLFDTYNRVLYNATFGTFMKEVVVRICNLAIILLFSFNLISFNTFIYTYVLILGIPPLSILLLWVIRKEVSIRPDWSWVTPAFRKEVIIVSLYGIIAGMSGIALINIDKYMVNEYLGLGAAGIYSIAFYFGTLVQVPNRAMSKISSTLIAEFWKGGDHTSILVLYKKSSISQYMLGGWIFLGVAVNIGNIFHFLPPEYASGKWVILFIGASNLVIMLSGMSTQIIATSSAYKWQNWLMIILIILVVFTNMLFIPLFGLTGAAMAAFMSTLITSFIRFILIRKIFGFQPYNLNFLWITIIIVFVYFATGFIPESHYLVDMFYRSLIVTILYFGFIHFLKVSGQPMEILRFIYSLTRRKR